jgi:formylglycine-generating enzyme required for sulfatase activity
VLIRDVLTILRRHRVRLSKTIWIEELLRLDPEVLPAVIREQDLPWSQHCLINLVPTLARRADGLAWARRVFQRNSPSAIDVGDERMRAALSQMYIEAYPDNDRRPPAPPGFDPALITFQGLQSRNIKLHQIGRDLAFLPPGDGLGSPLTEISSLNGIISIACTDLPGPRASFWPGGVAPSWASDWGYDDFGAWASFTIVGVTQRLRWIAAGRFLMGSPYDEPGRDADEGPVNEVTISKGFWLFDTPCPQALWQVVMGNNPSRFRSPDRPVERVSWDDAQGFITRLNAVVPGLSLCLPTEAQWEYACRAGTETALYTGQINLKGDNAPALDAIAWYNGNCSSGFELTHGHDVEDWAERQFLEVTGGPRPVRLKAPNGWGLYDMLGNVFEWCADGRRDYSSTPRADPIGEMEDGVKRSLRGGSWRSTAHHLRAACRRWFYPYDRHDFFGFRCVQGPGVAEMSLPQSPRQAQQPGAAVVEVGTSVARVPLTAAPALIIRSDCEEVHLTQITRPDWASAIGRDRFGLWTRIDIEGATQRLRWITPGRFLMGSPEGEPGRKDNEGPVHEVTISKGFWLFDTPCTQALWQAVMGRDPSFFKSPHRPVEQVSWNEVQGFIQRTNVLVPGLSLSLPTEAQWEYACRAGTDTALYTGPINIKGERNAPALDPIAWYGGNCGQGFELKAGYDISRWPETQFLDTLGGTHPVGLKAPNGWGLYDMLGNVWEWCRDGKREYTSDPQVDPMGPTEGGVDRLLRGGSWGYRASNVRAAFRIWDRPDKQFDVFGFRCARGQGGDGAVVATLAPTG